MSDTIKEADSVLYKSYVFLTQQRGIIFNTYKVNASPAIQSVLYKSLVKLDWHLQNIESAIGLIYRPYGNYPYPN